ncbi:hypothetical protein PPERSA_05289 [Pseudocohnilembus persalinus]|uniref:Uncharacterized protein n=1 Tax=Pseudocohnilembus persalinus TaxID=266149 RepID=A0A0V0R602_PSEPJ|nr:hypothetical protein PPERSA_05289 [Pseudocohnilembus persalinus]|eukprot:KRX09897.1 hypothetical protein PPERSA_05289 [Pseudocohnilembus persalinus]
MMDTIEEIFKDKPAIYDLLYQKIEKMNKQLRNIDQSNIQVTHQIGSQHSDLQNPYKQQNKKQYYNIGKGNKDNCNFSFISPINREKANSQNFSFGQSEIKQRSTDRVATDYNDNNIHDKVSQYKQPRQLIKNIQSEQKKLSNIKADLDKNENKIKLGKLLIQGKIWSPSQQIWNKDESCQLIFLERKLKLKFLGNQENGKFNEKVKGKKNLEIVQKKNIVKRFYLRDFVEDIDLILDQNQNQNQSFQQNLQENKNENLTVIQGIAVEDFQNAHKKDLVDQVFISQDIEKHENFESSRQVLHVKNEIQEIGK